MEENRPDICDKVRVLSEGYLEGKLPEDESREVEEHLKGCRECAQMLDAVEKRIFAGGGDDSSKYRINRIESRFAVRIMGRLLTGALVVFVAGYILFTLLLPIIFNKSITDKQEKANYAVTDLVQFTVPGARIGNIPFTGSMGLFNIYRVVDIEKPQTGGHVKSGRFDLAVPMYIGNSDLRVTWPQNSDGNDITFRHGLNGSRPGEDWNKLTALKNGTKTSIAAYFIKPLSVKETEDILNTVDGDDSNTWLSLDTGDLKLRDWYPNSINYGVEWGFPMMLNLTPAIADNIIKDANQRTTSMSVSYPTHSVTAASEKFKMEMKFFEKNENVLGVIGLGGDIRLLNRYLDTHDLKINGAVITAPTSNILKLRGNGRLARMDILKVDFDY